MTGPSRAGGASPDGGAPLAQRLAAVEAGIHEDRHRQPADVVDGIARLWSAGATVSAIAAETGASPHIVRDRLRRAGALEYSWRERHRHAREVLGRDGAQMIEAYEAGAKIVDLADGAGVSPHTLTEFLTDHGVLIRNRYRARTVFDARGDEFAAAYTAGATLKALAASAGVSRESIRGYLVSRGVTIHRGRGWPSWALLEARHDTLIAAYEAGATLTALAAEAGVSRRTIRRFLASQGVRLRTDGGTRQERRHAGG